MWFPVTVQLTNNEIFLSGVGSFQQYYEIGPLKGYSSSTISWIPALQLFFLFALGPLSVSYTTDMDRGLSSWVERFSTSLG